MPFKFYGLMKFVWFGAIAIAGKEFITLRLMHADKNFPTGIESAKMHLQCHLITDKLS